MLCYYCFNIGRLILTTGDLINIKMQSKNDRSNPTVQADRQWVRRCRQEEINLIDSYAGPKAERIQ